MDDVITRFFKDLGHTPSEVPDTLKGTLRFDLHSDGQTEHWLVTFDRGKVSAIESAEPAECVVNADKETFTAIIEGRMNAMAALLRGVLTVEGRSLLMAVFRLLIPPPEDQAGDLMQVSEGGGRA